MRLKLDKEINKNEMNLEKLETETNLLKEKRING